MFTPTMCHMSGVMCHVSCVPLFFFSDKVVGLVGGGSFIHGASQSSFQASCVTTYNINWTLISEGLQPFSEASAGAII